MGKRIIQQQNDALRFYFLNRKAMPALETIKWGIILFPCLLFMFIYLIYESPDQNLALFISSPECLNRMKSKGKLPPNFSFLKRCAFYTPLLKFNVLIHGLRKSQSKLRDTCNERAGFGGRMSLPS